MNCRIKASDVQYVFPGGEGNFDEQEIDYYEDVTFGLKMYKSNTFAPEDEFQHGDLVKLDANVKSFPIFLEATAQIPGSESDWMIHVKQCEVETKMADEDDDWSSSIPPYDFVTEGFISAKEGFVAQKFKMIEQRTQWLDSDQKTINRDQFMADLWQNSGEETYRLKATL